MKELYGRKQSFLRNRDLHLPDRPVTFLPTRTTSVLYSLMFLYVALRVVLPLRLRWW